ncbi:MAG: hypothetical protein ABSA96_10615 [Candidatus Acidiferrales bacterium]|jgi:hypothetical protein
MLNSAKMNYGKHAMLLGGLTILGSALAFEWATFSRAIKSYEVVPIALIAGLAGLVVWLAGCVMICRTASAPSLFGGGVMMLFFLFFGGVLLDHISPALTNVHLGMGGIMAPMAACFLGGVMFILVGIVRLGAN